MIGLAVHYRIHYFFILYHESVLFVVWAIRYDGKGTVNLFIQYNG